MTPRLWRRLTHQWEHPGLKSRWRRARRWRSWSTIRRDGRRSARRCRSFCRGCTRSGVRREDVTISVGVGRHAPVDAEAMRRRVGDGDRDRLSLLQPAGRRPLSLRRPGPDAARNSGAGISAGGASRSSDPDRLGAAASSGGLRRRVQADLSGHEPSDDAGSAASPGNRAGGRTRRACSASFAAGNAMRQAIHAAAARLGPCWSISHLAGGRGQVFRIVAGAS